MKNLFVFALLGLVTFFSCKSTKKIQTAVSNQDTSRPVPITSPTIDSAAVKADIIQRVNSNHIDFKTFTGKIKADYKDSKGKSVDFSAYVRMQKDSLIWVSITGPLNIEGYRVMVMPDTVIIMDKLNKTISYKSVSYLREMIKLPVDFYTVQDLLIGNPIFFNDNILSFKYSGDALLALSVGEFFKHLITVDTTDNRILHSKLDDVEDTRNRTCDITLDDYSQQQGRLFSNKRAITVTEKAKLDINMEYKQVSFDEPQTFPFNIPKSYEVK